MNKPKEHRHKILFINAVNEVTRERAQSFLEEEHSQKILKTYLDFVDVDGFARVATLAKIRANNANLSIPLSVRLTANLCRQHGPSGRTVRQRGESLWMICLPCCKRRD